MDDLISRRAAINAFIRKMRPHNNGDGTITVCIMSESLASEILTELPTAEKKGKWISHEGYEKCSQCGKFTVFWTRFCPNCGARMEEKND